MSSEKHDPVAVINPQRSKSRLVVIASFSAILLLVFIAIVVILFYFYFAIAHRQGDGHFLTRHSPEYETVQRIVDDINARKLAWKATVNPVITADKLTENEVSQLDVDPLKQYSKDHIIWTDPSSYIPMYYIYANDSFVRHSMGVIEKLLNLDVELPAHFDAREKWPLCASIHQIRNQAGCGSCWAESVTSAMSDRLCIHSGQKIDVQLSTKDLLECCEKCGSCIGGFDDAIAYEHWQKNGVVTGGNYQSFEGCKPYPYNPDCGAPCKPETYMKSEAPAKKCITECRPGYGETYEDSKYYGADYYFLGITTTIKWAHNVLARGLGQLLLSDSILRMTEPLMRLSGQDFESILQKELYFNGPLTVTLPIHGELLLYKSGVFHPSDNPGRWVYSHEVKLIGWGVENLAPPVRIGGKNVSAVPYWILANTWGRDWGEGGFFRVLRDYQLYSHPYFDAVAGMPANRHRQ